MTPSPTPSVCSFAEIDPYAFGPTAVPLHPPPPRLPEDVMACGGRQVAAPYGPNAIPAFREDILIIQLRPLQRLSMKLERWVHTKIALGDLVIVPRGEPRIWDVDGTAEALILSLPPALTRKTALQDADYDPTCLEFMPRVGHADPLVHAIGQAILSELQTGGLLGALYLESLFRTLALHLLRNHAVFAQKPTPVHGKLPPAAVQRVRDYVHAHLSEEITLETLAALVHLSPYHFARKFKAATGLPPYQYVLHCRVEQAKSLLMAGKHSISAVAQAVGFAGQSHLTRHIKHAFGVTPGALLPVGKAGVK
ncbi:MAG: AraC family transcriptional regulator [Caldilineaceae bacterium]